MRRFLLRLGSPFDTIAEQVTNHVLRSFWILASCAALSCGSDNPDVERRGEPIPDPTSDGGSGSSGDAGAGNGDPVAFCDALEVIRAKCQRCHQDPPKNGAPAAFLTYEDTQAPYPGSDKTFADYMLTDVESGLMPFVALNEGANPIMPPVEPLTDDEKDTLLTWLKQGAQPVGGTDCP